MVLRVHGPRRRQKYVINQQKCLNFLKIKNVLIALPKLPDGQYLIMAFLFVLNVPDNIGILAPVFRRLDQLIWIVGSLINLLKCVAIQKLTLNCFIIYRQVRTNLTKKTIMVEKSGFSKSTLKESGPVAMISRQLVVWGIHSLLWQNKFNKYNNNQCINTMPLCMLLPYNNLTNKLSHKHNQYNNNNNNNLFRSHNKLLQMIFQIFLVIHQILHLANRLLRSHKQHQFKDLLNHRQYNLNGNIPYHNLHLIHHHNHLLRILLLILLLIF